MTLDPIMTRERIEIPQRPSLSPAAKRRIHYRERGLCRWCIEVLRRPEHESGVDIHMAEFDHWTPRAINGKDDEDGIFPMHPTCHLVKTKSDRKRIAKAKAQEKLTKPRQPSRNPIHSRGFQKSHSRPLPSRPFLRRTEP